MNIQNITAPFIKQFPGDLSKNPMQRNTPNVLFSMIDTVGFSDPSLIHYNPTLATEIGIGNYESTDLDFLVGNNLPTHITPYATAYAGHQFGNWAGQLGDGRAIFAGEITHNNKSIEIQWKGAGATPYSRHADGRAVLRSSVREYLMSEAMFHLGVPTTRALSLAYTGEDVLRDILYDGHPANEPGAVVVRTAPSFIRFGHFELLSAQQNIPLLQQLTDYVIKRYYPNITTESDHKYQNFFKEICRKTAELMVDWYRVGFTHGVMNTDNMSILGLTIDYGPYAMLDEYDLNFTSNTTDLPGRRYAFGKQAQIAQWNLWQLANAIHPLIKDEEFLENTLNEFGTYFWKAHDEMLAKKFGFDCVKETDEEFFVSWQALMQELQLDYTLFFTELETWSNRMCAKNFLTSCSYLPYNENFETKLQHFFEIYQTRLSDNNISKDASIEMMRKNNPKFTLRNYLLFECIEELTQGKMDLFNKLWEAIQTPYETIYPDLQIKRPSKYNNRPGCSMLSCSS